jgi:hypothetical protein
VKWGCIRVRKDPLGSMGGLAIKGLALGSAEVEKLGGFGYTELQVEVSRAVWSLFLAEMPEWRKNCASVPMCSSGGHCVLNRSEQTLNEVMYPSVLPWHMIRYLVKSRVGR